MALGALGMGKGVLLLTTRPGPALLAPGCRRVGKQRGPEDQASQTVMMIITAAANRMLIKYQVLCHVSSDHPGKMQGRR